MPKSPEHNGQDKITVMTSFLDVTRARIGYISNKFFNINVQQKCHKFESPVGKYFFLTHYCKQWVRATACEQRIFIVQAIVTGFYF